MITILFFNIRSDQSLSHVRLFVTPWIAALPGLPVHHQLPEFTQTQRPLSQWCHPANSSSVVPFSSSPQSLPASESFPMSQLFAWGGQSPNAVKTPPLLLSKHFYHPKIKPCTHIKLLLLNLLSPQPLVIINLLFPVKNLPAVQETSVLFLGRENPLEKGMAPPIF